MKLVKAMGGSSRKPGPELAADRAPATPTAAGERAEPTLLLASMIRPLLPSEPRLDGEEHAVVEKAVVEFVDAQIASLPTYLRMPYRLALGFFNWSTLLRFGRVYVRLDGERQLRVIEGWTNSRMRAKRDVIKLLRSCALLMYLDHPLVLARLESDGGEESA